MQKKQSTDLTAICQKSVWTAKECAAYLGLTLSTLYKKTHGNEIPFSKPGGKVLYFSREEIERWAMSNRYSTQQEIAQQAAAFCQKGGAR